MAFGLYDIQDKHILEHNYGSFRGAVSKKHTYGNDHNIYIFEYIDGIVVDGSQGFNTKYRNNIQREIKNRNIK